MKQSRCAAVWLAALLVLMSAPVVRAQQPQQPQRPTQVELLQNYPNPFNPATTLAFRLREESIVTVRVYDLLGREMATLLSNEQFEEGYQTVSFEPSGMASGVYFYRMEAQGLEDEALKTIETRKMLFLK